MGIVFGVYRNWIWEFGDLKSGSPISWGCIWPNTTSSNPIYVYIFLPSTPSYCIWVPIQYNGVEETRICCLQSDVYACAFESTKLPFGIIAVNPAHVELPPRQRGLSSAHSTFSIYTTRRRLIPWRWTTTMNASGERPL